MSLLRQLSRCGQFRFNALCADSRLAIVTKFPTSTSARNGTPATASVMSGPSGDTANGHPPGLGDRSTGAEAPLNVCKNLKRRVAILVCGKPPPQVLRDAGPYERQFEALLQHKAHVHAEEWRSWDVYKGELPSADELAAYDAIVITGGAGDAYSDEAWVVQARDLVLAAHHRKQRMLGICFGHQLIAKALGGTVGLAPQWAIGAATITFEDGAADILPPGELPSVADINVSHRDQVHQLPEGARRLATTEACPVAMYAIGDHILCIQGHPEFSEQTVRSIVEASVPSGRMGAQEQQLIRDSYERLDPQRDYALLQRICTNHLRK